jgi:hypothetical protein
MNDGRAISGSERLPWLTDDVPAASRRGARWSKAWLIPAILLIAAVSYWFGTQSWQLGTSPPATSTPPVRSSQTVTLPDAQVAEPAAPEVTQSPQPQVAPVPVPAMPRISSGPVERVRQQPKASEAAAADSDEATDEKPAETKVDPLALWPVRVTDGASGRLVRVGTFRTVHQAKKGWWAIVRLNPSLKRLQALVVPVPSLRNSQTYYRLQMGTSSQAHSEVLCQRMRMIGQSCVVIDERDAAAK